MPLSTHISKPQFFALQLFMRMHRKKIRRKMPNMHSDHRFHARLLDNHFDLVFFSLFISVFHLLVLLHNYFTILSFNRKAICIFRLFVCVTMFNETREWHDNRRYWFEKFIENEKNTQAFAKLNNRIGKNMQTVK